MSEAMKATGIQWIGDIPESWDVIRIKHFTYMKGRIGWQGLTADEFMEEGPYLVTGTDFENGRVCWDRSYHITEKRYNEAPQIQLKIDDLLVTKDGTIGKLAYIDALPDKASLNSHLLVVRPLEKKFINRFLYWILSSTVFIGYYELVSDGSTMDSLSQEKMGNLKFPVPFITEQEVIANYLDVQCGKLDEIIADLKKQIDILQKYKKSVITEAVTKGLNKDATMKNSGVDWIGKIPEHWQAIRLKYVFSVKSGDAIINELLNEGDVPVYGGGKQMGTYPKYNVSKNTLLIGRVGANCGCVTLVKENAWATDNALVAKTVHYIPYIYYLLQIVDLKKDGDSSAQPLVTGGKIGNTVSAFTFDICEQQEIVTYLNQECSKIDGVIQSKENQLDVIQQHKQSLIFEYVTGKKRVKEVI